MWMVKNMYYSIANNMKDYYFITLFAIGTIATILLLSVGVWHLFHLGEYDNSLGAPTSTALRNIIPATNNKFDIGTTTPALEWKNLFAVNSYISGLVSCNTIDTNAAGLLACGTDETGASVVGQTAFSNQQLPVLSP